VEYFGFLVDYPGPVAGGALIIVANALVQALVFWLAGRVRTLLKLPFFLPFLLLWLGYEYFHNIWDLAWPWFNLGNTLITHIKLIQWYEFTGVRGGSLWIILTNFVVFKAYRVYRKRGLKRATVPFGIGILLLLLAPAFWSYYIFQNVQPGGESVKIALIQPNLDPYTEKFVPENQARHMAEFFQTAERLCDDEASVSDRPRNPYCATD
jgi:apolipoprotein N-acyltransferase